MKKLVAFIVVGFSTFAHAGNDISCVQKPADVMISQISAKFVESTEGYSEVLLTVPVDEVTYETHSGACVREDGMDLDWKLTCHVFISSDYGYVVDFTSTGGLSRGAKVTPWTITDVALPSTELVCE